MIIFSTLALTLAQSINPADYPELATDRLLPAIIADLKTVLPDPYSIRDVTVCPATRIKLKEGKPYSWTVMFALNARNAVGGCSGLSSYAIGFKNGRVSLHSFSTAMAGSGGIEGIVNRSIMHRFEKCSPVADAVVQDLLAKPVYPGN